MPNLMLISLQMSLSANWWALDRSCADYLSPRLMSRASIQGTLRTQDCICNLYQLNSVYTFFRLGRNDVVKGLNYRFI